jgi:hypothetical protein
LGSGCDGQLVHTQRSCELTLSGQA